MNVWDDVLAAAAEVQTFCKSHHWKFCFIGGIAVQRWGSPRFTQDVDLTLLTGFGSEESFIDEVLRQYAGRRSNTKEFALQRRTILARTVGGVALDISLGALSFEENSIHRANFWKITDNVSLLTCTAEDLVVHKVFAGRDRDWSDVESVLIRQHGKLNFDQIRRELQPLLELNDTLDSFLKFDKMIATVEKRLQ